MKTMKKRFLWLMLVLIAALLLAVGCTDQSDPADGEEPPISGEEEEPGILVEGLEAYTIVRTELGEASEKSAASNLANLMRDSCGLVTITTDYTEAVDLEILIGATNRPESAEAAAWAATQVAEGESWYYIGVTGNKIVLHGTGDEGVAAAVRYLIMTYGEKIKTGAVSLPEQQVFSYKSGVPSLVVTEKGTAGQRSVFVAIVDLGREPYFLDATGENDVTETINAVLREVGRQGGGVVYLPAGVYRISDTLTLPPNVTLRGEYVDPDLGNFADGTVLLADGKKFSRTKNLMVMSQGSLAQGLAIYYEKQSLDSPVPYAATITCVAGNGCWELRDLTLVNSYDGISNNTNPNGMVTVDNLKGTVLHTGYEMQQRADISIGTDITLSPRYWAAAGADWNAPAEADIRAYMKGNGSVGFYFGDCDRDTYENIVLDGFATGMYNREMTRAGWSGSFYHVQILDATVGIDASGIDTRYGLLLVDATVEASNIAVKNATPSDSAFCVIHLLNSRISGKTQGAVHVYDSENGGNDTDCKLRAKTTTLPGEQLFNLADYGVDATGKTDISAVLQKALDDASAAGGGIVYLPAGRYLLANPVTIQGNGVQLLGCNSGTHTQNAALDSASILLVTYGRDGDENAPAAITISGNDSGVTGFSVIYPENGVSHTAYETESPARYAYCIRATGDRTYVNFMCMVAVSRAVHFNGADEFVCDRLLMTVWDNGIRVSGGDGLISRIHTNGTYHTMGQACCAVLGDDWAYNGAEVVTKVLDTHIVHRLTLVVLESDASVQMRNVFHYGAQRYLDASSARAVVINGESSRLTELSFALHGDCDLTVINFMRPNPSAYMEMEGENFAYLYNWGAAHYSGHRIVVFES